MPPYDKRFLESFRLQFLNLFASHLCHRCHFWSASRMKLFCDVLSRQTAVVMILLAFFLTFLYHLLRCCFLQNLPIFHEVSNALDLKIINIIGCSAFLSEKLKRSVVINCILRIVKILVFETLFSWHWAAQMTVQELLKYLFCRQRSCSTMKHFHKFAVFHNSQNMKICCVKLVCYKHK